MHYIDHPDVAIINILNDIPGGLSCSVWGSQGDDKVPIIINDYNHGQIFGSWFEVTWSSPWYIVIDHNFILQGKTQVESEAEVLLEEMITNMER